MHISTSSSLTVRPVRTVRGLPGTDYIKIDTGVFAGVDPSSPNGLADPFAADTDIDGKVNYVYAGDLHGNLCKFDVSDTSAANWTLAKNRVVLFRAKDSSEQRAADHRTGRRYPAPDRERLHHYFWHRQIP